MISPAADASPNRRLNGFQRISTANVPAERVGVGRGASERRVGRFQQGVHICGQPRRHASCAPHRQLGKLAMVFPLFFEKFFEKRCTGHTLGKA
jgi:hypothetical protein